MSWVTSSDEKRAQERRVFERFCQNAGLVIVPRTLQQPAPPAPDVIVELERRGRVAFELVRLDHEDEMMGRSHLLRASHFFEREYDALPPARRASIASQYGDAEITIEFHRTATIPERRKALEFIWATLERLMPGFNGQLSLAKLNAPSALHTVWVLRAEKRERPKFRSFLLGSPLPVQASRIADKLQNHYACSEPLELLAYREIGEFSYQTDEADIRQVIDTHLSTSQFRRVWLFESPLQRVGLVFTRRPPRRFTSAPGSAS